MGDSRLQQAGRLKRGTVIFAGWEEHIEEAKEYIKKNGFTQEDVALVKRGEQTLVILK